MKRGGFTKSYRNKWDNPVFRSKQEAGVWAWMCDTAQWRRTQLKTKYGAVDLARGELLIAERALASDFGLHRNTLRALLQRMVDEDMITVFRDRCAYHAGTIIKINKYDQYQSVDDDGCDDSDQLPTYSKTDPGPIQDRSRTKNKEDKELKEDKESKGGAGAPDDYAFTGMVIRVKPEQLARWQRSYAHIPDWDAALQKADDYYAMNPPKDGKWFFPLSGWLKNENDSWRERADNHSIGFLERIRRGDMPDEESDYVRKIRLGVIYG